MADLLRDPNVVTNKRGVFGGYIDDLYWAATFDKMVQVIKFVKDRGPAYGYNLNMKKCVYLMTPTTDELSRKLNALVELGIPVKNVKIQPDCQRDLPAHVVATRRAEWGVKAL